MEKAFKKQITIWKKAVIKYRLSSSDCSSELNDILKVIRDNGDEAMIRRITQRYSKYFISVNSNFKKTKLIIKTTSLYPQNQKSCEIYQKLMTTLLIWQPCLKSNQV